MEPPVVRAVPSDPSDADQAFRGWLERVRADGSGVEDLYFAYYDTDEERPWLLSLPISAEVARYLLERGQVESAVRTGEALLAWQHDGRGQGGARLGGSFPSALETEDGEARSGARYNTASNLTIMEALLALYESTGDEKFLEGAERAGRWVHDVMSRGDRFGVWLEDYGAPMSLLTGSGDFDNRIPVGRTFLWLPTLRRLAEMTGDRSFSHLADQSAQFFAAARTDAGGFFDHYDPGWPPEHYAESRFQPFGIDGSVVADDSLRAALGALAAGERGWAERFVEWLPSSERIPGYLSLETGEPLFVPGDRVYYDIIASSLYAGLVERLGGDATDARQFVVSTQATNGGWYWGWDAAADRPLTSDQATLTGLWALMDLGPQI